MSKTKLRPDSGVLNILQSDISLQMQDSFIDFEFQVCNRLPTVERSKVTLKNNK